MMVLLVLVYVRVLLLGPVVLPVVLSPFLEAPSSLSYVDRGSGGVIVLEVTFLLGTRVASETYILID